MTGVGGGSLMTPLLVLVFGVSPATAVGTDLLYASLTKLGGSWVHSRQGTVDWKVVRLLAGQHARRRVRMALLKYLALDEETCESGDRRVERGAGADGTGSVVEAEVQRLASSADGMVYELHAHHLPGATIATGIVSVRW